MRGVTWMASASWRQSSYTLKMHDSCGTQKHPHRTRHGHPACDTQRASAAPRNAPSWRPCQRQQRTQQQSARHDETSCGVGTSSWQRWQSSGPSSSSFCRSLHNMRYMSQRAQHRGDTREPRHVPSSSTEMRRTTSWRSRCTALLTSQTMSSITADSNKCNAPLPHRPRPVQSPSRRRHPGSRQSCDWTS